MNGEQVNERILLYVVDVIDEEELRTGRPPAYVLAITSERLVFFHRDAKGFGGVMKSIFSGKWESRASRAMSEQDLAPLFEGDPEPRIYLKGSISTIDIDRGKRLASSLEIRTGKGRIDLYSFPKRNFKDVLGVLEDNFDGVHQTTGLLSMKHRK